MRDPSRRRRGPKRKAVDRVESLLDRMKGKADDRPERVSSSRFLGFRNLDISRHRETFERLVSLDFDFLRGQRFAVDQRVLDDLLPQAFAEPIPYTKGKNKKAKHLDTTIKATRTLSKLK